MVARTIVLGPEFDHLEDDQGETLGNASYHQDTAIAVRECLRFYGRQRGLAWYVSYQTPLTTRRLDNAYPTTFTPDVFIHTTHGSASFDALDVDEEGTPALIIEVLNPATGLATDLNPEGKLGAYAAMGVAEYLTFDPIGEMVLEQLRAWRLGVDGAYIPWEPSAAWRWQSALGIAFAPQGLRLRLFDEGGAPVPDVDELDQGFDEQARELAALRAELERLRDKR